MKIEVLGTGCTKCTQLEAVVKEAVAKSGMFAQVEKVDDIAKIMEYQVLSTPGLVIDGKVVSSGKLLSVDEVVKLITENKITPINKEKNMATKVLFVCIHNSARSQMAEAFLQKFGGDEFQAFSAGIEPGKLNPYVVKVLQEDEGIDISKNKTKSAFDFVKQGMLFHYVVTVCEESSQKCPIFPRIRERVIMSFEDPSSFVGSDKEILEKTRNVKNQIKQEVLHFIELVKRGELKTNFPKNWKLG